GEAAVQLHAGSSVMAGFQAKMAGPYPGPAEPCVPKVVASGRLGDDRLPASFGTAGPAANYACTKYDRQARSIKSGSSRGGRPRKYATSSSWFRISHGWQPRNGRLNGL